MYNKCGSFNFTFRKQEKRRNIKIHVFYLTLSYLETIQVKSFVFFSLIKKSNLPIQ